MKLTQIISKILNPQTNETLIDLSKLDQLSIEQLEGLSYEVQNMLIQKIREKEKEAEE